MTEQPPPPGTVIPPMGAMPHSAPMLAYQPTPVPGANGLAIAALCCGLVGFVPVAAIIGIVLGFMALNQLHQRIQRGKGMAVAGIVLGALWLLGWVALIADLSDDGPSRNPSGVVTGAAEAHIDDLRAGDCYSGGRGDEVARVTVVPCASPHEGQVIFTVDLPDGPFPGATELGEAAEKVCAEKAHPLVTSAARDNLRAGFIYPSDADLWQADRTVICTVEAGSGTTTGTALESSP